MEEEFKVSGLTTSSLSTTSNISTLYDKSNIYADTNSTKIDTCSTFIIDEDYLNKYNLGSYITTTTSCLPTGCVTTDSNELKINIKKFQIKFNFNL